MNRTAPSEHRLRLATLVSFTVMLAELAAGYGWGSVALTADGWHMATHTGALLLAALSYALIRRWARHPWFVFGPGKLDALTGFASALALLAIAVALTLESLGKLYAPRPIAYWPSLSVAALGLLTNGLCLLLVGHQGSSRCGQGCTHANHTHRATVVHLMADAFTSVAAIAALMAGHYLGATWLDPLVGAASAMIIAWWSLSLIRDASTELLDMDVRGQQAAQVRAALREALPALAPTLRVWRAGHGKLACIVTLADEDRHHAPTIQTVLANQALAVLAVHVEPPLRARIRPQAFRPTLAGPRSPSAHEHPHAQP